MKRRRSIRSIAGAELMQGLGNNMDPSDPGYIDP